MNRAQKLGAELVMAIRRRSDAQARIKEAEQAYDAADQEVTELEKRVLTATAEDLYVDTAEHPAVPDTRETEQLPRVRNEDLPCPGPRACAWYGSPHLHDRDDQIWNVSFQDTQESAYQYPS